MSSRRRPSDTAPRVILGLGGTLAHDANAALLVDGRLVAASQEERYSRVKQDGAFPTRAIHDCLSLAGLTVADVDACVFADKPLQNLIATRLDRPSNWLTWQAGRMVPERTFDAVAAARALLPRARLHYAWHHLAHAALAFATSPYERAAFLCVDGLGDDVSATIGVAAAEQTEIMEELAYEHGIGSLYALVTEFLGLGAALLFRQKTAPGSRRQDRRSRLSAGPAFKAITGSPMLFNTSFNVSGEPIVRTADEAWACFRHTALDFLVIDDRLFKNPHNTTAEEKQAWRAQFAD